MRTGLAVLTLSLMVLCVGCADPTYGLRSYQKEDLQEWEAAGQPIVVEKKPQTATFLGFFFGLGSFYTDEPVLGVVDLVTWPFSAIWEPWIAPARANRINYEFTRQAWRRRSQQGPGTTGEL